MGSLIVARLWASYTLDNFTYGDFKKNAVNYDGKHLPGVAKNTFTGGVDLNSRPGIFSSPHLLLQRLKCPSMIANSAYAGAYQLVAEGSDIHDRTKIKSYVFHRRDNAFSAKYSLGNDINAAAGRYYNAAAKANIYFIDYQSISTKSLKK